MVDSSNGNNKMDLLASLTGETTQDAAGSTPEQDLFGDIVTDDDNAAAATTTTNGGGEEGLLFGNISLNDDDNHGDDTKKDGGCAVGAAPSIPSGPPPAAAVPSSTFKTTTNQSSLLESSGLLGDTLQSGGGDVGGDNTAASFLTRSNDGGGGLFDAVDEELKQQQEEARRRAALLEQQEQEQRRKEEQVRQEQEKLAQQMQQQQQQQQMQQQPINGTQAQDHVFSPAGFYRNHTAVPPPAAPPTASYNGNLQYSITGGPVQTHTIAAPTTAAATTHSQFRPRPTTTAGMHTATTSTNTTSTNATMGMTSSNTTSIRPPTRTIVAPSAVTNSPYIEIQVVEPMLVASSGSSVLSFVHMSSLQPPHWTYQINTSLQEGGSWIVRRRFRHVVALEERLRQECAGAILPPRPEKHATRAIEEASTSQSAEFALQRAAELQVYLNQLAQHPFACNSNVLRLFLALQDDMGTAWPEVSANALTRLGAVGATAAVQLAESTLPSSVKGTMGGESSYYEDNAELLALASSEELRMGAVTQAVPKLEGSITLLREHGESCGAVGMELNKLTKEMETADAELSQPLAILSSGLLRAGRREKRLALELGAAMSSFVTQYKLCKNERLAFQDRRNALSRCHKERAKADERAQKLLLNPSGDTDRVERDAVMSDTLAMDAVREAEEIGRVLKEEVNRVAFNRRTEWSKSMKIVASAMKEASTERVAIWESTRESFLQAFPDLAPPPPASSSSSSSASVVSGRTA